MLHANFLFRLPKKASSFRWTNEIMVSAFHYDSVINCTVVCIGVLTHKNRIFNYERNTNKDRITNDICTFI